jgi:hypothetical protein
MIALYSRIAYPLLLALCFVWLVALVVFLRARGLRQHRVIVAGALLLTVGVFCLSPPAIGVLPDEGDHLSIARNLRHRGIPLLTERAPLAGPANEMFSDRPLLFPVLVSLLHIAHESWRNGFVVNFIALWGVLALAGVVGRRLASWHGAIAMPLLVLAVPAVTVWSTSSSYDLLSLFFVGLSMVLAAVSLSAPSRATSTLFWATLALAAHVRAENLAFCLLTALVVVVAQRRERWVGWLIPALVASIGLRVVQLVVTRNLNLTEMRDPDMFSLRNFAANMLTLVDHFFLRFSDDHQAQVLNWVALGLALVLVRDLAKLVRRRRALIVIALSACAASSVAFGFAWHSLDIGHTSRYALWLSLALALMPLAAHLLRPRLFSSRALLAVAVVAVVGAVPKIRTAHARGATFAAGVFAPVQQTIGDEPRPKQVLLLVEASVCSLFTSIGCACLPTWWMRTHPGELQHVLSPEIDAYYVALRNDGNRDPPPRATHLVAEHSSWPRREILVWKLH